MEYRGYIGKVEFDDEAGIFHGEVINMRDVITFQGLSVEEIRQAFKDSIEDYLEFCAERNEEPDKKFSGKLTLRLKPELHRKLYVKSHLDDKSINAWISEKLESAV